MFLYIYSFTPQRYELKKNNTKKLKDILYLMKNIVPLWIGSMFRSLRILFPITFSQSLRKRRKNLLTIGGIGLILHVINDLMSLFH